MPRQVLGAAWRINLRWPDGGIVGSDAQIADVVRLVRQCRPRTVALPYWDDRHPDHRAASEVLRRAVFRSGLRRFAVDGAPDGDAWRPEWICYYFINDSAPVSFAVDVSAHYQRKRDALACHRSQFTPGEPASVETRLTSPRFLQMIESRDAHLGALTGVAFAEGIVRQGAAAARDALPRRRRAAAGTTPVNIGIVCYASVGGSGIVATELAKCLAARGHDVHMISTDTPFRYSEYQPGLSFHRVNTPAYPLFREPQYVLSLATSIVHVARARELDIIHAHYAVPHATAAYLARQILETTAKDDPRPEGGHHASRH